MAHLNIDSIRNKYELLINQAKGTVDNLMIFVTKIEKKKNSFPTANFLIDDVSQS